MAGMAKEEGPEGGATCEDSPSPLETAKQIAATMCRQQKEAYWLGVRMENFFRAHQRKIESVTTGDVCDFRDQGIMSRA